VKPSAILNAFIYGKPEWQEDRKTFEYKYNFTKLWLQEDGKVASTAVERAPNKKSHRVNYRDPDPGKHS
jgi:hypothetical protein